MGWVEEVGAWRALLPTCTRVLGGQLEAGAGLCCCRGRSIPTAGTPLPAAQGCLKHLRRNLQEGRGDSHVPTPSTHTHTSPPHPQFGEPQALLRQVALTSPPHF